MSDNKEGYNGQMYGMMAYPHGYTPNLWDILCAMAWERYEKNRTEHNYNLAYYCERRRIKARNINKWMLVQ